MKPIISNKDVEIFIKYLPSEELVEQFSNVSESLKKGSSWKFSNLRAASKYRMYLGREISKRNIVVN